MKKTINSYSAIIREIFLCFLILIVSTHLFGQGENNIIHSEGSFEFFDTKIFIAALAGCLVQECIYWFELRNEIAKGNIPISLKSGAYWVISLISFLFFSYGSVLYFVNLDSETNAFTVAIFAAGFPRVFKGMVSSIVNNPPEMVAESRQIKRKFTVQDYFFRH
ncbi:MAG: hypothetical protein HWE07_11460 [Cytophagia bacterium]|nr:hypothetical protein [Cytophagia bacterium]